MLFLFLPAPLLELLAVCVLTLGKLPSQRRKGLLTLFFVMLGLAAALWCGGLAKGGLGLVSAERGDDRRGVSLAFFQWMCYS